MENEEKKVKKDKINWQIILPVILALILVGVFFYFDYARRAQENNGSGEVPEDTEYYNPQPLSPSDNPGREEGLNQDISYGCAGPHNLEPEVLEEPSDKWVISKNNKTRVSLGKYRITAERFLVFDIPKIWVYFTSSDLSNRKDELYGLEDSYVSKMLLIVNEHEREIKLGGSEFSFIELDDYPFGDLYPYNKNVHLDFEFVIELQCENVEGSDSLGNEGEPLDYIDGANVGAVMRLFAVGCQEFTRDLEVDAVFEY
ncbi:MAG: hypothetical protein GF387_03475 [Candidatus Portnoybacteria bacterium]|nr:hypothetical protein [Candidatus Portnoybacteria bacterium]